MMARTGCDYVQPHKYVVSLTLVRLHARLLCAGPRDSLTDESLMLHHIGKGCRYSDPVFGQESNRFKYGNLGQRESLEGMYGIDVFVET